MSSYIDHQGPGGNVTHSWSRHTANALRWQYGPERAAAIRSGTDARTQADVVRWNALGRRSAA